MTLPVPVPSRRKALSSAECEALLAALPCPPDKASAAARVKLNLALHRALDRERRARPVLRSPRREAERREKRMKRNIERSVEAAAIAAAREAGRFIGLVDRPSECVGPLAVFGAWSGAHLSRAQALFESCCGPVDAEGHWPWIAGVGTPSILMADGRYRSNPLNGFPVVAYCRDVANVEAGCLGWRLYRGDVERGHRAFRTCSNPMCVSADHWESRPVRSAITSQGMRFVYRESSGRYEPEYKV